MTESQTHEPPMHESQRHRNSETLQETVTSTLAALLEVHNAHPGGVVLEDLDELDELSENVV